MHLDHWSSTHFVPNSSLHASIHRMIYLYLDLSRPILSPFNIFHDLEKLLPSCMFIERNPLGLSIWICVNLDPLTLLPFNWLRQSKYEIYPHISDWQNVFPSSIFITLHLDHWSSTHFIPIPLLHASIHIMIYIRRSRSTLYLTAPDDETC